MGESWVSAGSGLGQGSPGAKKEALAPWAVGKLSQAVTSLIVSDLADSIRSSALKSSLKTAKRLQLDRTKTAMEWTCSLGLSVLRLEDHKKTGCGPVLSVETGLFYPYNYPSKHI